MSRADPQVNFRMPEELRALVREAAADSGRSFNAEMVNRLWASFGPQARTAQPMVPFKLRLPTAVIEEVKASAARNGRSAGKEIEVRLQQFMETQR